MTLKTPLTGWILAGLLSCAALGAGPAAATGTLISGNASGAITPVPMADVTPFLNMTTATTTKIITGASGKKTYITHARFHASGTTTSKLVTGTGTNCGTSTADLTETLDLAANDGETFGSGLGPVVIAGAGLDVCVFNGSAVNLRIGLAETQF